MSKTWAPSEHHVEMTTLNGQHDAEEFRDDPVTEPLRKIEQSATVVPVDGSKYSLLSDNHVDHDQRNQWHFHWLPPTILLGGLVLGVAVSIGHHFFYASLDGREASADDQEHFLFVGLILARLVSVCLTTAAAVAYRQWIWGLLRRQDMPVGSIDTLFSLDTSVAELVLGFKTWRVAFIAMSFACFLWALQIPSLLTPGTLSTINRSTTESQTIDVPTLKLCQFPYAISFATGDSYQWMSNLTRSGCYTSYDIYYVRLHTGLVRTIAGTAYSGQIPAFHSPCPSRANCSYTLNYMAPTLKCQQVNNPPSGSNTGFRQLDSNGNVDSDGNIPLFIAL